MMNFAEKNRLYCQRKSSAIYQCLYENEPLYSDFNIGKDKNGIWVQRNSVHCYLHSIYNKEEEFKYIFTEVKADTDIVLYFGTITPELITYWKYNLRQVECLIIVDPAQQILLDIFTEFDLESAIRSVPRILQIIPNYPPEMLAKQLQEIIGKNFNVMLTTSIAYRTLFSDYWESFLETFIKVLRNVEINFATSMALVDEWLENIVNNYSLPLFNVKDFSTIIQGRPVIIVSAGPSLKKNVELLRTCDEKAIIIAVGSSVPTLNKLGIRPHFNAGIDSQQGDMFNELKYYDVPLLCGTKIQHETLVNYKGARIFFIGNSDYLDQYIFSDVYPEKLICYSGMSIAVSIVSLVSKMGASKVIFIGQDMCLYNNRLHLIHTEADETVCQQEDNLKLVDIYGQPVESPVGYWAIKGYLEDIISQHPEVEYVNATEGGLGLAGTSNQKLSKVLDQLPFCGGSFKNQIKQKIAGLVPRVYMEEIKNKDIPKDIEKTLHRCEKILLTVKNIGALQQNKVGIKKIEQELKLIDRQMAKIQEISFYKSYGLFMNAHFEATKGRYSLATKSKDTNRRIAAKLNLAVGLVMFIQAFCNRFMDIVLYKE